jgi:hypothetical protein
MRYRLMATYLGAPYQVGLGPDGAEATLFAACPPPEELGFISAAGHWRKQVSIGDLDALWQSRPLGEYRGEPCLVLDDLGDRLHIAYLGRDTMQARQLGYWEIDREVFEVVVARQEVAHLSEEVVEVPLAAATFPPSRAGGGPAARAVPGSAAWVAPGPEMRAASGPPMPDRGPPEPATGPPEPAGPVRGSGAARASDAERGSAADPADHRVAAWHGSPAPEPWPGRGPADDSPPGPSTAAGPGSGAWPAADTVPPRGRRAARKDRVSAQAIFADLLAQAAIPRNSYAVDEEIPGSMCLVKTDGGYEVFSRTDDARLEVRFFEDEEAAYFYLFGVLAAEAVRSGRLGPTRPNGHHNGSRGPAAPQVPAADVSKLLRRRKLPN